MATEPEWCAAYKKHLARLLPSQAAIVRELAEGVRARSATPLRVLASAGSGKTTVMVAAAAYLVNEKIVKPEDLLLTTFTNKAGGELRERYKRLVPGDDFNQTRVGTFHSLAGAYMRARDPQRPQHGWVDKANIDIPLSDRVGGEKRDRPAKAKDYTARDVESKWLWRRILSEMELYGSQTGVRGVLYVDKRAPDYRRKAAEVKDIWEGVRPKDLALWVEKWRSEGFNRFDSPGLPRAAAESPWLKGWELFDRMKDALGAWDFGDSLWAYWQRGTDRAAIVVTDECQDNNFVQLDLARQMAERGRGRLVVVGDVRQSIYGFRGAKPEITARLDQTHGAMTLEITENHRSGRVIVEAGNAICYKPGGTEKWPWAVGSDAISTRKTADGSPFLGDIVLQPAGDVTRSTRVAVEIQDRVRQGAQVYDPDAPPSKPTLRPVRWGDFAILCRTNALMGPFEASLVVRKIPYVLEGSSGFFNTGPARKVLALLLLAFGDQVNVSQEDAEAAFFDVWRANPDAFEYKRAEDAKTRFKQLWRAHPSPIGVVDAIAEDRDYFLTQTFRDKRTGEVERRYREEWQENAEALAILVHEIRNASPFSAAVDKAVSYLLDFVEEADPTKMVDTEDSPDREMLTTFRDIVSGTVGAAGGEAEAEIVAIKDYASLDEMVRRLQEQAKAKRVSTRGMTPEDAKRLEAEHANRVVVSTCHKAKGREWPEVYLCAGAKEMPLGKPASASRGGTSYREEKPEEGEGSAEEERLFYVAVTRARDRLTLAWQTAPSAYIDERIRPVLARYYPGEVPTPIEPAEAATPEPAPPPAPVVAVEDPDDVPTPAPAVGGAAIVEPVPETVVAPVDPLEEEFLAFCAYVEALPGGSPITGMPWAEISHAFKTHRGEVISLIAKARAETAPPQVAIPVPEPIVEAEGEVPVEEAGEAGQDDGGEEGPPSEVVTGAVPVEGARPRVVVDVKIPDPLSHHSAARLYLGPGSTKSWVGPILRGKTARLLTGTVVSIEEGEPGLTTVKLMQVEADGSLWPLGEGTTMEFRKDPKRWPRLLAQAGAKLADLYTRDPLGDRPHLRPLFEWTAGVARKLKEIPATLQSDVLQGVRDGVLRKRGEVVEWAL